MKTKEKKILIVTTAVEICNMHGIGNYLPQLIPPNIEVFIIPSENLYLESSKQYAHVNYEKVNADFELKNKIFAILCIPYSNKEIKNALAIKQVTSKCLVTFLMDDQFIIEKKISKNLLKTLLGKSDCIFAISNELKNAYEKKFQKIVKMWPPVQAYKNKQYQSIYSTEFVKKNPRFAMFSNIWSNKNLCRLAKIIKKSDIKVDWYGNGYNQPWIKVKPEKLAGQGIHVRGWLPDADLIKSLRRYPCIIIPSGQMDKDDDKISFSKFSLPSRIFYLLNNCNVPLLIFGSKNTAAARFVKKFQLGLSCNQSVKDIISKTNKIKCLKINKFFQRSISQKKNLFYDRNLAQKFINCLIKKESQKNLLKINSYYRS